MRRYFLLLALAALSGGCTRPAARPDVFLVTVDGLRFAETSTGGGQVETKALEALESQALVLGGIVTSAPGGAPAMASVLTGLTPGRHGMRSISDPRLANGVTTLASQLEPLGYVTAAFLDTDQVGESSGLDRGFLAWDAPEPGFPVGEPGQHARRPARDTVAATVAWLARRTADEHVFTWIHFDEPAPPELSARERPGSLAAWDRLIGDLRAAARARERKRGVEPVFALVALSSHGPDLAHASEERFLLQEPALRVRAWLVGRGLEPRTVDDLCGIDEIAAAVLALAEGRGRETGASRILDLARGRAAARESVEAETLLPLSSMSARPVAVAVASKGIARTLEAAAPAGTGCAMAEPAPTAADVAPSYVRGHAAHELLRRGEAEAALTTFREQMRLESPPPSARLGAALALMGLRRLDEASEAFEAVERACASGGETWRQALLGLAACAEAADDVDAQRAHLSRLIEPRPADVRGRLLLGAAALAQGDLSGTQSALAPILEANPRDSHALALLGAAHSRAGNAALAATAYEQARRRRPVNGPLLLDAARAARQSGDYWTALERLDEHVALFGKTDASDVAIAAVYHDTGRWLLAKEFYERAVAARGGDAELRVRLAEVILRGGDEKEGRARLEEAKRLDPTSASGCVVLAQWLASVGRRDEARREAQACAMSHAGDERLSRLIAGLEPG